MHHTYQIVDAHGTSVSTICSRGPAASRHRHTSRSALGAAAVALTAPGKVMALALIKIKEMQSVIRNSLTKAKVFK